MTGAWRGFIILDAMSKAYWRVIQDEIEAMGWSVTRAVKLGPNGEIRHLAKAGRGEQTCVVEADSERVAMEELKKAVKAAGDETRQA